VSDADPIFERLLKNKRVAVVGPSLTTIGLGQGRAIDASDLVVRFNDAIEHMPFESSLAHDLGTRADIVYVNPVVLRKQVADARSVRMHGELRVQYLVCTNNALRCSAADVSQIRGHLGPAPRLRVLDAASRMLNRWLQGHFGRTGFIAIADLLSYDIGHLYVTGMTFYHGGGHLFPQGANELHPLKNRDGTWARDQSGVGHDSYLELQAMRVLARCFRGRLTLDEPLQRLLDESP
jgi:Glycosyltransferase family 29 (sialyltransferase)